MSNKNVVLIYRVLYVDDEYDLLELGKQFLEQSKEFNVDIIPSAPEALDLLSKKPYDAIISDYQMPEMDGIEFLRTVRNSGNSIPFILFTGRGREVIVIQALNEGANFYLQKGGNSTALFAELAHKVRIAVDHHRSAEKIKALNRLYSVLSAVNKAIVHLRTKDEFFAEIFRILVETGGFRMAWIGLADPENKIIRPVASAGYVDGYLDTVNISTEDVPRGRGATGTAYREGKYYICNDISGDPRMEPWREDALERGYQAIAAFPFAIGTKNAGVLTLYAPVTGFFDEEIVTLLDELARDVSFALKTIDDQNARKAAEEMLQQAYANLEKQVGERTIQLSDLNRDLLAEISERKRAEKVLQEEEAKYRRIYETTLEGIWGVDEGYRVIFVNPKMAKILGYPEEEVLGRHVTDFVAADEKSEAEMRFENRRLGLKEQFERRYVRKDGEIITLLVSASPILGDDGRFKGSFAMFTDISGRKRAEEALRESEQRYRELVENLTDCLYTLDQDGIITYVSPVTERYYGYSPADLLGKPFTNFVFSEDLPGLIRRFQETKGGIVKPFDWRLIKKSGGMSWVRSSSRPVADKSGTYSYFGILSDISQQKNADEALRKSEARLEQLARQSNTITWEVDVRGLYTYVSNVSEAVWGYRPEELVNRMHYYDLHPSAGREAFKSATLAVIGRKEPFRNLKNPVQRKDGRIVWISTSGIPLLDADGSLRGYQGNDTDITDARQAEEALQESERSYRGLFNTIRQAIYIINPDGTFLDVNDGAEAMYGYKREEFIGRTPEFLSAPGKNNLAEVKASISRAFAGEPQIFEFWGLRSNGEIFPKDVRLYKGTYFGKDVIIALGSDITGRKQAEDALRKSEERFRHLVEDVPIPLGIVNKAAEIVYINDRFTSIFGYTHDEIPTMKEWGCRAYPDEDYRTRCLSIWNRSVKEATEKMSDIEPCVYDVTCKDGTIRHVVISGILFDDTLLITLVDITDRKQAEEAIKQANRKLNLLSAITRHDIKNQLFSLMAFLEISKKYSGDAAKISEFIHKEEMVAKTIERQIVFTKEYESIGVNAPVWQDCRTLVDTVAKQVHLGEVFLKNNLPAGAAVFADPLIVRVFYNLIDNAVRHGGKITTIRFSNMEHDGNHIIICEDDGEGVALDEKEQIFERGFGKNTGLGLFLAREILGITGITIRETGGPGNGARFEITVPRGSYRMSRNSAGILEKQQ